MVKASRVLSIDVGLTNLGITLLDYVEGTEGTESGGFVLRVSDLLTVFDSVPKRLTDDRLCEGLILCFDSFFAQHAPYLQTVDIIAVERQHANARMSKVAHMLMALLKVKCRSATLRMVAPVEKLRVVPVPTPAEPPLKKQASRTGRKDRAGAGAAYRARKKLAIEHARQAVQTLPIRGADIALDTVLKKADPCDSLLQALMSVSAPSVNRLPDAALLQMIQQMSVKLAPVSDPDQIQIDLIGFATALENYITQSARDQVAMIELLQARHSQDVTYIAFLKSQVDFERCKQKVRGQQNDVYKNHLRNQQNELNRLKNELNAMQTVHTGAQAAGGLPFVCPDIFLTPPVESQEPSPTL